MLEVSEEQAPRKWWQLYTDFPWICFFSRSWSSAQQNNQSAGYDECPANVNRSRGKSVKEEEIGDLKYNEQRRDVHSRDAGELNWR